jgi:hypothetical protein
MGNDATQRVCQQATKWKKGDGVTRIITVTRITTILAHPKKNRTQISSEELRDSREGVCVGAFAIGACDNSDAAVVPAPHLALQRLPCTNM